MTEPDIQQDPQLHRQNVAILGATGSIGDSTLAILASYPEQFCVYALSGYGRLEKLLALCQQFSPKRVAVPENKVDLFAQQLKQAKLDIDVVGGQQGLIDIATDGQVDTVVAAIVGAAGLPSTLAAAQAGKRILLANKESLVMAGNLLIQAVQTSGATLLPLDSEHNAIFQCLPMAVQQDSQQIHQTSYGVQQLWLTASGGPFLYHSYEQMQMAGVEQAIKHPNWSMGKKISVDSATMMNKGLELIEACHLFALPEDKIEVVIHPQSIIHSLVEYVDGSFLAQLGSPDMKTPIAHALAYPKRIDSGVRRLSLYELSALEFIKPDLEKFACLKLARSAMQSGAVASIVLNAANEVAVSAFIDEKVKLTDIALINERTLDNMSHSHLNGRLNNNLTSGIHLTDTPSSIDDILAVDKMARQSAWQIINQMIAK